MRSYRFHIYMRRLIFVLLLGAFVLSACQPAATTQTATDTPEFGSGSEEMDEQPTQADTPTPEPVSTLSAEQSLELEDLGWIAFTASDEGRRDVWMIRPDGSDEFNLTRDEVNSFAEAPVWSPDGSVIAYDGIISGQEQRDILLISVAREGAEQIQITFQPGYDCYPSFSPDGERIIYMSERDGNRDLYIMDLDGTDLERLTEEPAYDYEPAWSPEGSQVAFVSRRTGKSQLYVMDIDGSNVEMIAESDYLDWRPAWSPDGEWIAFESWREGNGDIYIVRPDGSDLQQLTTSKAEDGHPHFSPDGRYIVFHSQRTGNYQLFIMEFENPENIWHLPTKSVRALLPGWSPPTADFSDSDL